MSGNGAYEEEMNEVVLFERALRVAVPTQPERELGAVLVPRLAEVARAASIEAGQPGGGATAPRARSRRPRLALVARVGIAVALLPLLVAGLAVAGVTVPEAARSAFESVGVELPNQPDESSRGGDEGTTGTDQGGSQGSATGQEQKAAGQSNGKAKGKAKSDEAKSDDPTKPGRRVRRHGEGPIPGPASPPEGKALGHSNDATGGSQRRSGPRGNSQEKAGLGSGKGQGAVHGKGLAK